jgi:hypothetical protein
MGAAYPPCNNRQAAAASVGLQREVSMASRGPGPHSGIQRPEGRGSRHDPSRPCPSTTWRRSHVEHGDCVRSPSRQPDRAMNVPFWKPILRRQPAAARNERLPADVGLLRGTVQTGPRAAPVLLHRLLKGRGFAWRFGIGRARPIGCWRLVNDDLPSLHGNTRLRLIAV